MAEVQYITVDSDLLFKNSWNSNQVSSENEAKIRESIKRNGLFKPIIVRTVDGLDGYEIIGGEHRWEQAVELGIKSVPIVNLGKIDDAKAKEIGVIDNARYGFDDALSLGDILKDIGMSDDISEFLPYGEGEIEALISSSDIVLEDLEIEDNFELEEKPEIEEPVSKPEKTHALMRFKISLSDAERVQAIISKTRKEQGFTKEDELTNSGDALVHLLSDKM